MKVELAKSGNRSLRQHDPAMRTAHRCTRKTTARTTRRLVHRLVHRCTVGRRATGKNHYPALVTALRHAVRVWRRLMKLYPEFYDTGFYIAAQKRWEEDEQHRRRFEPMLHKVYGEPDPDPTIAAPSFRFSPPPMTAAKRCRIEKLEAERQLWMSVASAAREQADKQLQQHRPLLPSFGTLASLLDISFTLRRIASGMETNFKPDPHASQYDRDFDADLERAYGQSFGRPGSEAVDPGCAVAWVG